MALNLNNLGVNNLANTLFPQQPAVQTPAVGGMSYAGQPATNVPTNMSIAPVVTTAAGQGSGGGGGGSWGGTTTPAPVVAPVVNTNAGKTVTTPTGGNLTFGNANTLTDLYASGQKLLNALPGSAASLPGASIMYNPTANPDQAEIDRLNGIVGDTSQNTDPNSVYQQTLTDYQSQIDAINNIYNDMLNNSRITNAPTYKARLDQNRIGQVLGGLVASPLGQAQTNNIDTANRAQQTAEEEQINAQRANELNRIYGNVRSQSNDILAANKLAKAKGADAMLEFYNVTKPAMKAKQLSGAIKSIIAAGADPSTMTPEELKSFTDGLGVTKDELQAAFNEENKTQKAAQAKADQEAMKALPAMAAEYEYAKKNGYTGSFTQYQNEDANRKNVAARVAKDPSTSEKEASAIATLSAGLVPGQVIPGTDSVPFIDDNGYLTVDGFKAAVRAAQQDGLPRAKFLKEFGSYFYGPLLSAYGITPKEQKDISGALPATN